MAKYYIKTDSLELIFSTNKEPRDACITAIRELLPNDTYDEYMYCDERGYRGYDTADKMTKVYDTMEIMIEAGMLE